MSGISTSSSDSHEFILVAEQPAPSGVVTVAAPRRSPPSQSTSSTAPPSSPPRPHRRLVKRSHPSSSADDHAPSSDPPVPSTPPAPHFATHSRRGSASPGGSSPRQGSPPIIAPHESLVGDVQMSKTRVIISKTHTVYDPHGMPFRFWSCEGQSAPIIKAITPTSMGVGPSTSVTDSYSTTAGLHLGYTTAGKLELSHTASTSFTHSTQARVSSSGVETNELWLTLREDPTSRQGIPSTVDFAALIHLTSPPPFEAELSVGVTIGRGPQALLKMLSSPQEWIALYDGFTTLNPLRLSTPTSSELNRRASGLVVAPAPLAPPPPNDDVEMTSADPAGRPSIRVVKRKPSIVEC
ncbi:hypothetical protein JCM11491_000419 [Sporobolomyces phaffii]